MGPRNRHRHPRRRSAGCCLAVPVATPPARPLGDAGRHRRRRRDHHRRRHARDRPRGRRRASSGSRSPPASSSRSTAARSPPSRRMSQATRTTHPRANLSLLGFAPLSSDADRAARRGARRRRAARRAGLAVPRALRKGLDLQGGLEVVLQAKPPRGHTLTPGDLDRSVDDHAQRASTSSASRSRRSASRARTRS